MYDRFRLLKVTNYYALYYGAVGFLTSVLSRSEREATVLVIDDSDGADNHDEVITADVIAMASVELECPIAEYKLGGSDAKYKTLEVNIEYAIRLLEIHVQRNHRQGMGVAASNTASRNMRERQKKPTADMEMTEARWRDFENQWERYKCASGVSGQEVVDDLVVSLSDASGWSWSPTRRRPYWQP